MYIYIKYDNLQIHQTKTDRTTITWRFYTPLSVTNRTNSAFIFANSFPHNCNILKYKRPLSCHVFPINMHSGLNTSYILERGGLWPQTSAFLFLASSIPLGIWKAMDLVHSERNHQGNREGRWGNNNPKQVT